ncbi:hypothetical protein Tco_0169666 [Tanacetum coccineum]
MREIYAFKAIVAEDKDMARVIRGSFYHAIRSLLVGYTVYGSQKQVKEVAYPKGFYTISKCYDRGVKRFRKEERSLINTLFFGEYECSSLALKREGRDEKKILNHLKQDQEMLVIKIFSERKEGFFEREKESCEKIRAKRSAFQQGVDIEVFIDRKSQRWRWKVRVDVIFDGAFRGVEDEEVVVGEGVVMISSSLDMLTNRCLGGIMVSLIFLEGLDEEALVEFMVDWCEEDEDDDRSGEDDSFN